MYEQTAQRTIFAILAALPGFYSNRTALAQTTPIAIVNPGFEIGAAIEGVH
jgi:hypothetical protein